MYVAPMTTVDIEHLLRNDEVLQLLDAAEQGGSLKATAVADVVETHELDALEQDALYRELDRRGIEIAVDEPKDEEPPPRFAWPPKSALLIGAVGFCAVFAEGAALDWSAVYLRDQLETSAGLAAACTTGFMLTMAVAQANHKKANQ